MRWLKNIWFFIIKKKVGKIATYSYLHGFYGWDEKRLYHKNQSNENIKKALMDFDSRVKGICEDISYITYTQYNKLKKEGLINPNHEFELDKTSNVFEKTWDGRLIPQLNKIGY